MPSISIELELNDKSREQAETIFSKNGLNFTSAFQAFVDKTIEEGKIPFELLDDEDDDPDYTDDELFYGESNMSALKKSAEQFERGEVVTFTYEELLKLGP